MGGSAKSTPGALWRERVNASNSHCSLACPGSWTDASMLGPTPRRIDDRRDRRMWRYWAAFAHDGIAALDGSSLRI